MNLLEEIEKMKNEGYNEANAQARVCQDVILHGISKGSLSRNVTIKNWMDISTEEALAKDIEFVKGLGKKQLNS